jgi:signal recognition particle GTPase
LTPSEDSAKTEEEKKDEQEVKQEEKKEETSKSNTSESKKDNTASTSSSSNKNNSSSSKPSNSGSNNSGSSKPSNNSGSKPAEHTHNWVAQYKTVNVPEKGHNEQVLVQAAYDEQVPITEMKAYSICNDCGADITGNTYEHVKDHMINDTGNGGYHTEWRETVVGYNTVHHDAVYETRYVVDSPATTKQELTGYKCSGCGKTKAN